VEEYLRLLEERAERIGATKLVPDGAAVLKGFLRRAVGRQLAEELLPTQELRRIADEWARRRPHLAGRTRRPMYTWAEARRILEAARRLDSRARSRRMAHLYTCLVGLCLYTGARPAEIRRLRLSNFSEDFSTVTYWAVKRGSLVERLIPDQSVREAIAARFAALEKLGLGRSLDPPLFPGRGCLRSMREGAGPRFISHATAWRLARAAAEEAGVESRGKPFYGFRRLEVTTLLEKGVPTVVVQKLKGWRSGSMVLYYHKTPAREMARQAAEIIAEAAEEKPK